VLAVKRKHRTELNSAMEKAIKRRKGSLDSGARSAKHHNRQPRRKQAVKSIIMLHDMHEFADSFIVAADD
jgi:hypothetical protein